MMPRTSATPFRLLAFDADPVTMARRLLGCRLVRVLDGVRLSGMIVETEAYLGARDRAAHTFGGRRTPRNEAMYLPGGHAYVYFTYGMHHCLNVVCGERDEGVAVLLRAIEPIEGLDVMASRRGVQRATALCSGPAKLCQALGIDLTFNCEDMRVSQRLFIEETPESGDGPAKRGRIVRSPRVGVGYAGEWALKPLRFHLRGNPYVSSVRIPVADNVGILLRKRDGSR